MSTGYANNNEIKNILVKLQEKTATANGEVKPDSGYDGLSKVNVNVEGGGSGGDGELFQYALIISGQFDDNSYINASFSFISNLTSGFVYEGNSFTIDDLATFLTQIVNAYNGNGIYIAGTENFVDNGAYSSYACLLSYNSSVADISSILLLNVDPTPIGGIGESVDFEELQVQYLTKLVVSIHTKRIKVAGGGGSTAAPTEQLYQHNIELIVNSTKSIDNFNADISFTFLSRDGTVFEDFATLLTALNDMKSLRGKVMAATGVVFKDDTLIPVMGITVPSEDTLGAVYYNLQETSLNKNSIVQAIGYSPTDNSITVQCLDAVLII